MSIVDQIFRTVTGNGVGCTNTATFENPQDRAGQAAAGAKAAEENPWMKTARMLQTSDGRPFFYCSDLCEISGIEAGYHNQIEKPKVEIPTGGAQAQIAKAAAAAKALEEANRAIKSGQPATVHLT